MHLVDDINPRAGMKRKFLVLQGDMSASHSAGGLITCYEVQ